MRKTMTREVTLTTVKLGRVSVVEGRPAVEEMEDVVLIGNITLERAQREVRKSFGNDVTVFGVQADTKTYELPLETFIEIATVKGEQLEAEME